MGDGFTGSGRSYDTVPQRTESPAMYAEGENPEKVLEFLSDLSDESEVYLDVYDRGMLVQPGESPGTGEQIAEGLEPEEGEGYVFALYGGEAGSGHPIEDTEIYAAFSNALPRGLGQRIAGENPRMVDGARVTGNDEALSTEKLWKEARKSGLKDTRPHVKFERGFRSLFGHQLG
jgi:hypothetical protein